MRVRDLNIEAVFIVDRTNPQRAHLTPDCCGNDLIPIFADGRHRWTDIPDLRVCSNCLGVPKDRSVDSVSKMTEVTGNHLSTDAPSVGTSLLLQRRIHLL